jgi:L-fuconolactonase
MKATRMRRVDAHHHVWDLISGPQAWLAEPGLEPINRTFTLAELSQEAAAAGIDRTILVQVQADLAETALFLALAADTPLVGGVVGWADLTAPDLADTLATLRSGPGGDHLVGIRHLLQSEADPGWLDRAAVREGLRAVGAAGLCYDLLTLPHQLPAAIRTVRGLPDVAFVLDHLSKPPIARGEREPWSAQLRELAAEPNVTAKLSGLVTEAEHGSWELDDLRPYVDTALDAFGPDRLMFGSDWPVCLLAGSYHEVFEAAVALTAGLSPAEQDAVFGGTAQRVYAPPIDLEALERSGDGKHSP